MKIFLTGSTGFLGKAITQLLPQFNYFKYKRGDNITQNLLDFCPDIIIHSAGEIYKEEQMISSNILLTHTILEYLKNHKSVKMIYFGSSSEYGKKTLAMKETDVCDSQNLYAATKTAGTLMCLSYARSYDCDICVVRPFSVYGDYEPKHRLIPSLYNKIISGTQIDLIQGTHDFIYISDFVELLKRILESPKTITQADIVNAGTGVCYTNIEVANKFAQILNKPVYYNNLNKFKSCDSPWWVCDTAHAKKQYDFVARFSLEKGLKQYILFRNEHQS
jgi:nucleoside-diphosphate-sugar epimerase